MTLYLLIDTCNIRKFVSRTEFGHHLKRLIYWVESGKVILLVPEALKVEWTKHREISRREIKKDMNKHAALLRAEKAIFRVDIPIDTSIAEKNLESQIDAIDKLMDGAIHVVDHQVAVFKVHQQKKNAAPPFHNKKDSEIDALLLFNTLQYCTDNKLPLLYFISDNYTDFAAADDPSTLHPGITGLFPDVSIRYYKSIGECFSGMEQDGLVPMPTPEQRNHTITNLYPVDKNARLLDQVFDYLVSVFKEWNFLPHRFFLEHYPFITDNRARYVKQPFTLYTNNGPVYDLLLGIQCSNGRYHLQQSQVEPLTGSDEKKLKIIVDTLSFNYVYLITKYDTARQPVNFIVGDTLNMDTLWGKYFRFEIPQLFDLQPNADWNANQLQEAAYIQAKLGNFQEAARLSLAAADQAIKNNTGVHYYISHYNLKHLSLHIRMHNQNGEIADVAISEYENLKMDEILAKAKTPTNKHALEWLHSEDYIYETALRINELVVKIRSAFYRDITGHNNFPHQMYFEFCQFIGFIVHNNIIVEEFSDVKEICNSCIEGILASIGSNKGLGGRLTGLSDLMVLQFIHYGNFKVIQEYINRYSISIIPYHRQADEGFFVRCFKNLLATIQNGFLGFALKAVPVRFFWNDLQKKIETALVLFTYLDLPEESVDEVAISLLSYLQRQQNHPAFNLIRILGKLIEKQGHKMSQKTLLAFFHFCVLHERFNEEFIIYQLHEQFKCRSPFPVHIPANLFQEFQSKYLLEAPCRLAEDSIQQVGLFYLTTDDPDYRRQIVDHLVNALQHEFDPELYYHMAIEDILPLNTAFEKQYICNMYAYIQQQPSTRSTAYEEAFTNGTIDQFLNFMFRLERDLRPDIAVILSKMSNYYKWLLDLEGFNYVEFDYRWIYNHYTMYYKARYRKSDALKRHLLSYIRQHPKSKAQGAFIHIYHID